MFCITVLLASCVQYAISFVLLLVQDMRQIFLIKFMNILAARKQIISPTAARIKDYLFFFLFNQFLLHWTTCMKLILEGLYDFAEILYFFTLYYFFYAFTVQHFLPLIFHHGLNKDSQLWSNIETHNFFKEIKLHNFRHGLTLQLPDKYFSMFYLINNNFGMY